MFPNIHNDHVPRVPPIYISYHIVIPGMFSDENYGSYSMRMQC